MTDKIKAAIEESREREKAIRPAKFHIDKGAPPYVAGVFRYEPRFREALAVAVNAIGNIAEYRSGMDASCARSLLARIERILAGEEKS